MIAGPRFFRLNLRVLINLLTECGSAPPDRDTCILTPSRRTTSRAQFRHYTAKFPVYLGWLGPSGMHVCCGWVSTTH